MARLPLVALAALLAAACSREPPPPRAAARQITNRADLVGGVRSLGDLGDFLIENDKVRVVIQGPGFSRGFGVYGGSLIDADLRRPADEGPNHRVGTGFDTFGELFPAFFLQAVAVDTVEVESDGSDGGPARVVARGSSGDFLELAAVLNQAVVGSLDSDRINQVLNDQLRAEFLARKALRFENIYELAPGARHVAITLRVTNTSDTPMQFPGKLAQDVLPLLGIGRDAVADFTVPLGDVALYGAASRLFLPGVGYNLRFGLDDAYQRGISLPNFPGVVTDWVASRGLGTSYGLTVRPNEERNYAWVKRAVYGADGTVVTPSSLLLPFVAGGFVGVFYENAPPTLAPEESFEFTRYFVVGAGDVGSVLDEINRIHDVSTGRVGGMVFDEVSGRGAQGASVIIYQRLEGDARRIYSQYDVREGGAFTGDLVPGRYSARVQGPGRPLGPFVDFEVRAGQPTGLQLMAPTGGRVVVQLYDAAGHPCPGKATAVGVYAAADAGRNPREFLFDLEAGEEYRTSDLIPDDPSRPETRRYIEEIGFAQDGIAELLVRPGTYTVFSSRGPEYDVERTTVEVRAGQTVSLVHRLRRVVDTTGYLAADFHLHSINSIDAGMSLDERVLSIAAEGVEWAVATDHNFVTDYEVAVQRMGLEPFMRTSVGLEVTTLESGHFNGYPLDYEVGPVGHGSFEWARRAPEELFAEIRALGRYGPENTIVQVNHPRDTILGYFGQYDRSALTLDPLPAGGLTAAFTALNGPAFRDDEGESTFSFDFDAIEILNGKLFWQIHHYRVPDPLPQGELPANIPPPGTILLDSDGEPVFPGVVDDWYTLLNRGERTIGVGTSDSHAGDDEAGYFRTLVFVGADNPRAVTELDLVRGLKSRRAVATNGPLLELYINDPVAGAMGGEVVDGDGTVTLGYRLTAAPWIGVHRINVIRNGVTAQVIEVARDRDLAASPLIGSLEIELARGEDGAPVDSWFLLEAVGDQSLFPVVRPAELPPLLLDDALASLAGPLGFGTAEYGDLRPAEIFPVTAYALTNPVWVKTAEGRPWQPPGPTPLLELNDPANRAGIDNNPRLKSGQVLDARLLEALTQQRVGQRVAPIRHRQRGLFERNPGNEYDVRRLFSAFGHGHHH